jgi:uncharacterized protein YjiS (DUF1127 family)
MRQAQTTFGTRRSQFYRPRPTFGAVALGSLAGLLETLQHWLDLRQQRRALTLLDDRMLKDVGLSQIDVDHELRKPFWQV